MATTTASAVVAESALSRALAVAIIPKLLEFGWSTGGDDDAFLAEYIVLLLVNGKTQEQIAAELAGDLLNLGQDDPQVKLFSVWLFEQIEILNSQISNGGAGAVTGQDASANISQDEVMGDTAEAGESNVPTGPKSMRNGGGAHSNPRDKRMLGHLAKAMDRSNDSILHRVRPHAGNERINSHRAPPTGPRQPMSIRGGARAMNGRPNSMQAPQGQPGANSFNMNPQQQEEFVAMLQQQQFALFNMMTPQQQEAMQRQMQNVQVNPVFNPNFGRTQQPGKSLFERVQAPPRQNNSFRGGHNQSHFGENHNTHVSPSSSMDVQMSQDKPELSPDTTCRFNLSCTNKDCKFAHQSPEAPPGTAIDVTDVCSFGAACKNRKCTGRHPSPAQKIAHQTEMDCKFFPNCTNARCPFKHPTTPACRNGADCTTPNCKFTHVKTACKFNPCLNPGCIFKHEDGQKRGKFEDKVWVAKEHVSERKFTMDEDTPEELIIPGAAETLGQESGSTAELIT